MELVKPEFSGLFMLLLFAIIPVAAILSLIFGFIYKKRGLKIAGFLVLGMMLVGALWMFSTLFI